MHLTFVVCCCCVVVVVVVVLLAGMKDMRRSIRSPEWQIQGVRSAGRPKRRWIDDIEGQQGVVWTRIAKDRESWRTLDEGYFL